MIQIIPLQLLEESSIKTVTNSLTLSYLAIIHPNQVEIFKHCRRFSLVRTEGTRLGSSRMIVGISPGSSASPRATMPCTLPSSASSTLLLLPSITR